MVKYILVFFLLVFGIGQVEAQQEEFKRHEIKVNGLYLLIGAFEASYEHNINEESSFGTSLTVVFEESDFNFGLTPYYRLFFGRNPAAGFFVEGNAAIFSYEEFFDEDAVTAFGLGLAIGGKFLTKKQMVVEAYIGLGRIFGDSIGVYPRIGISFGKRF